MPMVRMKTTGIAPGARPPGHAHRAHPQGTPEARPLVPSAETVARRERRRHAKALAQGPPTGFAPGARPPGLAHRAHPQGSPSAGPEGPRYEGKVYNVSNEEAKALLDGKYAEPVRDRAVERATNPPNAEHADESEETPRRGRRGGKKDEADEE